MQLTDQSFLDAPFPVPPTEDQTAIVRFLNYIDRRIRRYIRAKQRLIKLLEEQNQVVVHQAVIGQIDVRTGKPYPAYKDSGVEWLGRVPEGWDVRKLKYVVSFSGGGTPAKAEVSFWNGDIPWVSPKDMKTNIIDDATDHVTREAITSSATSLVEEGAVLVVVRSGILRRYIPAAVNTVPVAVNQDMKVLRPQDTLNSFYLLALIEGNQSALLSDWTKAGTTVESIEYELMANCRIPIPPVCEQMSVVDYLADVTARANAVVKYTMDEISLVSEYRTRLIADVVTGKLDVREAAANLPDEAESLEDDNLMAGEDQAEEIADEEEALEEVGV